MSPVGCGKIGSGEWLYMLSMLPFEMYKYISEQNYSVPIGYKMVNLTVQIIIDMYEHACFSSV